MKRYELIAPCHFGLEAVLKQEITDLGYDVSQVEDGRVTFIGDDEAVCRANIGLRTAERILIKVGSFRAETFDELFENTKALPWEEYIPCRWEILGGEGGERQEQALLTVGYPVHHEKGDGRTAEAGVSCQLVWRGGTEFSCARLSDEGYGDSGA